MSESHPEAVPLRSRTLLSMMVDCGCGDEDHEDTLVEVEHVYLAEEDVGTCENCGCPHRNPGMVALAVGDESVLLSEGEALRVAHRLIRGADLCAEAGEDPPDLQRDMARFGALPELPRSTFKPGDVIAVPPEVVRVTRFSASSRLVIKRLKASMRPRECKACGTDIKPGDLYAASSEPTSDRCIRCVDGWPLATIKGVPE
jgi:hypothetical protein